MYKGLFRQQAIDKKLENLNGDVFLLPVFSHVFITAVVLVWLLGLFIWMVTGEYSRKATVSGWLEPNKGISRIFATGDGVITEILVSEGEAVTQGDNLFLVRSEQTLETGANLGLEIMQDLILQRTSLEKQLIRIPFIYERKKEELVNQADNTVKNLVVLRKQKKLLEERVKLIKSKIDNMILLQSESLIAQVEIDSAKEDVLRLLYEKQSLALQISMQSSNLKQLATQESLLSEDEKTEIEKVKRSLSESSQKITQAKGREAYFIRAPISGEVSNVQISVGNRTNNNALLATMVPENSSLIVQLLVPVRSIGFIAPGQKIKIRYDAFPYQKFGLYSGEVLSVSKSILLPDELHRAPISIQEPVYKVSAELEKPTVLAYENEILLKTGMTLNADVTLEERTIYQWVLEPIYSLTGRL